MSQSVIDISLFQHLRHHFGKRLEPFVCTKPTLVHISHALEDLVLHHHLPALIFTGFQESSHWAEETQRYRELAEVAHQVCIFAGGQLPPESHAGSLHVTLTGDDPLRQEWFLCILSTHFAVVLCGQDQHTYAPDEASREFDTIWTFEPAIITELLTLLIDVVAHYRPERVETLREAVQKFPPTVPDTSLISNFVQTVISFESRLQARLRSTEMRLNHLADQTLDLIYRYRPLPTPHFEYLSPAIAALTGDTYQAHLKDPTLAYQRIHPDDRQQLDALAGQRGQVAEPLIIRLQHRDGSIVWTEHRCTIMSGGPGADAPGVIEGIARDMTERKRAEELLVEAKEHAEIANRAKSAFLASMSHELRTPLNAILGFTQLMLRDSLLPNTYRENLTTINRSGEHLLGLINDVLEVSKIEAGHSDIRLKPFDLHQMLDTLDSMFRLRASNKNLHLLVEHGPGVPHYIISDEGKLRQILTNLLSNAIKFTDEGGVMLRVELLSRAVDPADTRQHARLSFEVEDSGVGIPAEELATLFDAFVQTSSGKDASEGTGLGLTISQQFAHMLGSELRVVSEVGKGTCFSLELLVEESSAEMVSENAPARRVIGVAPGQPAYRILVVEDKLDNRTLLRALLLDLGFTVREAENGQRGIEIWEEWEPHLIFMDMRMPVLDGYRATRQIKSTTKGQATAIIALTASAFEEERRHILSIGCDNFVRKPFRVSEICDLLHEHLGVEFLYAEQDGPPAQQAVAAFEQEVPVPADWLQQMQRAADLGDAEQLLRLAEVLHDSHPQLVGQLTYLIEAYAFDQLETLLSSLQST